MRGATGAARPVPGHVTSSGVCAGGDLQSDLDPWVVVMTSGDAGDGGAAGAAVGTGTDLGDVVVVVCCCWNCWCCSGRLCVAGGGDGGGALYEVQPPPQGGCGSG